MLSVTAAAKGLERAEEQRPPRGRGREEPWQGEGHARRSVFAQISVLRMKWLILPFHDPVLREQTLGGEKLPSSDVIIYHHCKIGV